jgi:hypothetical protein
MLCFFSHRIKWKGLSLLAKGTRGLETRRARDAAFWTCKYTSVGWSGNFQTEFDHSGEKRLNDCLVLLTYALCIAINYRYLYIFYYGWSFQRYAVIPLSTNSGLIGWVPHCDTLHTLVHDYREKKKILLNIEHRIMLRMAPDYDHLTLMQKVEVFEHALEHTQGDDLARLLWLKSPSSEVSGESLHEFCIIINYKCVCVCVDAH